MHAASKKDVRYLGTLIRPNGTRLPVTGILPDGKISVMGVYVEFETTLSTAIASGYSLEDASPVLSEAWDKAATRRQAQLSGQPLPPRDAIHDETHPDRDQLAPQCLTPFVGN
jgi:hypothetical protein